jgi:cephalosporin-C deacetylase
MRVGPPLKELEKFAPGPNSKPDFEICWKETLTRYLSHDVAAQLVEVESPITAFETYDVTVAGYNGDPIKGWFIKPKMPQMICHAL